MQDDLFDSPPGGGDTKPPCPLQSLKKKRKNWLEHVPIICTHSLHDGSSLQPDGRTAVERMSR
jgi:hypothetical protein